MSVVIVGVACALAGLAVGWYIGRGRERAAQAERDWKARQRRLGMNPRRRTTPRNVGPPSIIRVSEIERGGDFSGNRLTPKD